MNNKRPAPLQVLQARAEARALLLHAGEYRSFEEALYPLWAEAIRRGLVRQFGEQTIKQIIELPFLKVVEQ